MIVKEHYSLGIDELSGEVARILEATDMSGSTLDNRISALPDMRTIRYYTSLGLLDRPTIVGRTAKYNRRHVLQLLAIKALQQLARPLAEIQERLYGLSDSELEAMIAAGAEQRQSAAQVVKIAPIYWREIVIEPGLKIMAEQSWSGIEPNNTVQLLEKIKLALESLKAPPPNQGRMDQ